MRNKVLDYSCLFIISCSPLLILKNGFIFYDIYFINKMLVISLILSVLYLVYRNKVQQIINCYVLSIVSIMPLIVMRFGLSFHSYGKINYVYILSIIICILILTKFRGTVNNYYLFDYIIAVYILLVLLSTLRSVSLLQSIEGYTNRNEGFAAIACYVLIFFVSSKLYKFSKKHIPIILASVSIVAIYGILQYFGIDKIFNGGSLNIQERYAAYSTIGNQNFLGSYIILFLPLTIFGYVYTKKYYYLIVSAFLYLALLCTFTRSAWLAFLFVLIILAYLIRRFNIYPKRLVTIVLVVFSITLFFNFIDKNSILGRFMTIGSDIKVLSNKEANSDNVGSRRMFIWKRAITLVPDNMLLGSGPDTFAKIFTNKYKEDIVKEYKKLVIIDKAHNEYLQIALTTGLPALICYLLFAAAVLYSSFKNIKNNIFNIPLICCILGYLAQAFLNISVVSVAPIYWFLLGMTARNAKKIT